MISLEQVRQLDIRVKKAVTAMKTLSAENEALKNRIAELEADLDQLQREATNRKADEEKLEVSLQGVLDVLDEVDDKTSDVEPEPPEDNYVIETVGDETEAEADEEIDNLAEDIQTDSGVEVGSDSGEPVDEGISIQVDAQTEDADETEVGTVDDEPQESADSEPSEAEELEVSSFNGQSDDETETSEAAEPGIEEGPSTSEEAPEPASEEADEEVRLDEDGNEAESSDDDRFQSEFDIF